jgi:hypothetical protein
MKIIFKTIRRIYKKEITIKEVPDKIIFQILYLYEIFTLKLYKLFTLILVKDKRDYTKKERLYVFVPVWGEKHIDMFMSYGLPSVNTDDNLRLLQKDIKVSFFFYTKKESLEYLSKKLNKFDFEFNIVLESDLPPYRRTLSKFLTDMLKKAVKDKAMILLSPPDTIFSDFSILNMVKMANGKGVSIALPHGRVSHSCVSKELKNKLNNGKIDSRAMVDIFLTCQHSAFKCSSEEDDINCIPWGAISSNKFDQHHVSVIHNLPSIYLITPTKSDILFFNRRVSYYIMDHLWQHLLMRESRLKVIGSSDIAFAMEITDDDDKSPVSSFNMRNDRCVQNPPFAGATNSFICSWIGNIKK